MKNNLPICSKTIQILYIQKYTKLWVSERTFVAPHVSLPNSSASLTSSVMRKLSKMVPDFTWTYNTNMIYINTLTAAYFFCYQSICSLSICSLCTDHQWQPYLPQVQTDNPNVVKFVNQVIWCVFWVVNLRMLPCSFVVGVVNLFRFPFTLKMNKEINKLINTKWC